MVCPPPVHFVASFAAGDGIFHGPAAAPKQAIVGFNYPYNPYVLSILYLIYLSILSIFVARSEEPMYSMVFTCAPEHQNIFRAPEVAAAVVSLFDDWHAFPPPVKRAGLRFRLDRVNGFPARFLHRNIARDFMYSLSDVGGADNIELPFALQIEIRRVADWSSPDNDHTVVD
jgi:hypothetical protein